MKNLRFCFALLAMQAFVFAGLAQAQDGQVLVKKVTGQVERVIDATGQKAPLQVGDKFGQGSTIVTGATGTAMLALSNGSLVNVSPNTSLSVTKFFQAAIPDDVEGSFDDLAADPSRSETRLTLNYGDVIGQVRKLRDESKFEVATQVGVAGIRGTTFQVTFTVSTDPATGIVTRTMVVKNAAGDVVVSSPLVGTLADTFADVADETSATIEVTTNTAGQQEGQVVFGNLSQPQVDAILGILPPEPTPETPAIPPSQVLPDVKNDNTLLDTSPEI